MKKNILIFCTFIITLNCFSQSLVKSVDFSLGSPFSEPDGRKDLAVINSTDFVTLAKTKGNITGKSDFILVRFNKELVSQWKTPLQADVFEDYKEVFFNGSEIVLLSVIHNEKDKNTKLEAYGFNIVTGVKSWTKELETYTVGDWDNHPHKGKVKESFIDIICEHANSSFVTPIEYKHNINFSPDGEKFISYVYNYGEKNLTATVCVYDKSCKVLMKSKISIDDNYVNHGLFINNEGKVFIVNANYSGKLNIIKYDLASKDFEVMELPGSNFMKDDFQIRFFSDDELYVACTEQLNGTMMGVLYTKFNFKTKTIDKTVFESINGNTGVKILEIRRNNKMMKGDEDWKDYDITSFFVDKNEEVTIILEKHLLYADRYPHIERGVFDASHNIEINGHVQAEGVIIFKFGKDGVMDWIQYIAKNQIFAASDGLNTISYIVDNSSKNQLRLLYASSESLDSFINAITIINIEKATGKKISEQKLDGVDKSLFVREYTNFMDDGFTIVTKKGLLGKSSSLLKYKF